MKSRYLLSPVLLLIAAVGALCAAPTPPPSASVSEKTVAGLLRQAYIAPIKECLSRYQRALELARRHRSRDEMLAVATAAQSRGEPRPWYEASPDPEAARPLQELALTIREELAPDSVETARSLLTIHRLNGQVAGLKGLERPLKILKRAGPQTEEMAVARMAEGSYYHVNGKTKEAQTGYLAAFKLLQEVKPDSVAYGWACHGLCALFWDEIPKSRRFARHGLRAFLKHYGPDFFVAQQFRNTFGILALRENDLVESRRGFESARAVLPPGGPETDETIFSLVGLARVAQLEGNTKQMRALLDQALTAEDKLASGFQFGWRATMVADMLRDAGELGAARRFLQRAAQAFAGGRDGHSAVLRGSWIAYDQGDWGMAARGFQRALRFGLNAEKITGVDETSSALRGLGYLASLRSDWDAARALLRRSLASQDSGKGDPLALLPALTALAAAERQYGRIEDCRSLVERARRILAAAGTENAVVLQEVGALAHLEGNLSGARAAYERALTLIRKTQAGTRAEVDAMVLLARLLDETGQRAPAVQLLRDALPVAARAAENRPLRAEALRLLARLVVEDARPEEAGPLLTLAAEIDGRLQSMPLLSDVPGFDRPRAAPPLVRFVQPAENSTVTRGEVSLHLAFLAPIAPARYRIWINGRPLGGAKGFDLPQVDDKGQVLDKGRVLDRGEVIDRGRVLDRGQVLDKGAQRDALAAEVPPEVAELVRRPQYAHFLQLRHTVPLEDTDGEFLRVAVQLETSGGSVSERQLLRLRRPAGYSQQGSLRALCVGVSQYDHLPDLKYAAADSVALAAALQAQAGDARLYRGINLTVLSDQEATLVSVNEAIDRLVDGVQPGDTVVLSLSGHGIRVGQPVADLSAITVDAMMSRELPQAKFYFAPVRFDPANASGTGLLWSEIVRRLERARKTAKAVWVLADCCRAAPGLRRESVATSADLKRSIDEGGNLILCTASSGDSPSYESDELKQGIFTQAWLDALSGKAPPVVYEERPLGRILTLAGLQFAVDYSVRQHARKAGVRQQVEFPRLEGSFSPGQPVFVPVPQDRPSN